MHGWPTSSEKIRSALAGERMLNPAMELATNICPWNCGFCFTEDPSNPASQKKRLANEMSLERRLKLIDEAADLGAESINFVGAGEPTIDPNFFVLLERMQQRNIIPIVYSEGALKLTDTDFCSRLFDTGATIVLKVNSLENKEYQNAVVAGPTGRKPLQRHEYYFDKRNKAIENLISTGFNKNNPTRLAFDTICQENLEEIPRIHRYARDNNIFVLFVNYLPSGRSTEVMENAITGEQQALVFKELARIDSEEYALVHRACFPYAGGVPCTIRGLGLYVKIGGKVLDCPGESEEIGNLKESSLKELWEKCKHIRGSFDGGCLPRRLFWNKQGSSDPLL
jgi:MoaA/NifB/PqqE/SkfB family radical SAM enzyme